MITSSYDTSQPVITPKHFNKIGAKTCDICLITYSKKILDFAVSELKAQRHVNLDKQGVGTPLYVFDYEGINIGIFMSSIGAVPTSMNLLAAHTVAGVDKFISFGSAGSLDSEATRDRYIVPTFAYRDEGLSYHYAPAEDFIEIKNSKIVSEVFERCNIPFSCARIWTTDAPYMETANKVAQHKAEGCVAVDMEISGLQAVCDFCNLDFYCFVETGDVVSPNNYSRENLGKACNGTDKLYTALSLAKAIIS